jgi:hypothetical protein
VITPETLREIQPSPLYNVKQLKLRILDMPLRWQINQIVDAFLWISPLLETLSIEWQLRTTKFDNIAFKSISFKVLHMFIS